MDRDILSGFRIWTSPTNYLGQVDMDLRDAVALPARNLSTVRAHSPDRRRFLRGSKGHCNCGIPLARLNADCPCNDIAFADVGLGPPPSGRSRQCYWSYRPMRLWRCTLQIEDLLWARCWHYHCNWGHGEWGSLPYLPAAVHRRPAEMIRRVRNHPTLGDEAFAIIIAEFWICSLEP